MPKATPIYTNFTAGEFSPLLEGRVDIARYYNAAKTLENFLIMFYGGIRRRPGTYYVNEVKDSSKKTRLIPFQFSTTQAYILEFGHEYIRFYMDHGQIQAASAYEISSPYQESELFELQFAQDADVMWIVHPSHKPRKLSRTAHNNWTLTNYAPTADPFTGADDYPSCVMIYEMRLFFANTNNEPQTIWGSKSGDYDDMTTGATDDDALKYTIGSEQANAIRWLSSGKVLIIGTLGGGFSLSSGSDITPLTPTNVVVKRETTFGSIAIVPKKIGNYVYYVQRNARTIREFAYSWEIDEYEALDMTLLAEHITKSGLVDIDYQQSPYNILWCVRSDGVLATLTRQIKQEVMGWSRQLTDGYYESVAVIPGDGTDDEVWVIVRRTIDGSTKRYIEYLMPTDFGTEQEDCFFVDSGLTLDDPKTISGATQAKPVVITATAHGFSDGDIVIIRGVIGMTELNKKKFKVANKTADTFELNNTDDEDIDGTEYDAYLSGGEARKCVTTVSGLGHLEGKTVHILADGAVSPSKTVSGGSITLDAEATGEAGEIHIGLPFISKIQTMRAEAGSKATAQTKIKRIRKVAIRLFKSLGIKVGDENKQDIVPFRSTSDEMDSYVPLFTGDKELQFPGDYGREGYVVITQDQPVPLTILAIILYLETYEG